MSTQLCDAHTEMQMITHTHRHTQVHMTSTTHTLTAVGRKAENHRANRFAFL